MSKKIFLFVFFLFCHVNVMAGNCIDANQYPSIPLVFFSDGCGEESPDSTFFEPKIRVRIHNCNLISCIDEEHSLKWDGQCVTTVGPYLLPLIRMCARVAIPADIITNKPADPGYTEGKHLDEEGNTVDDELIPTSDGGTFSIVVPKLCLYKDPSFLEIGLDTGDGNGGIDLLDTNPIKQPFHRTVGMHPVVEAIVFFIDNAATFTDSSINMITSLFSMLGDGGGSNADSGGGNASAFAVLADALSFVGDIITLLGSLITDALKEIGQINRVVDEKIYGCVNIPLGPYPPPFCETLVPFSQKITLQNICHVGDDGLPIKSLQGKECVVSTLRNNYIHNSLRIGYDNFVPICKENEDPMSTDKCVVINNLDSFASAKGIHEATNRRDVIKSCADGGSSGICVQTMIPHRCSVTQDGCDAGFRIIYGVTVGSYIIPKSYFRDDLSDCPNPSGGTCQTIWGINTGEFVDVSLVFEQNQEIYDITPLSGTVALTDGLDQTTTFTTSIVRMPEFNTVYSFNQEPKQFCVFDEDKVIGCKPRAPAPKITTYECGTDNITGLTCTSDYYNPQFIAGYEAKYKTSTEAEFETDSTYALIAPETVTSTPLNSKINLAGDNFEPFVTDDTFKAKPFSGPNSPEPNSIYGNYLDGALPVVNGVPNPNAIYVDGIEYLNGKYHVGGKFACLIAKNYTRCPLDPTICVLTKLLNTDTVRCSEFSKKFNEHQGIVLCTADQTSTCTQIDSMVQIGGGLVPIRACDGENGAPAIKCYDGSVDLCIVSNAPEDRVDPSPDLGRTLSDSQFFNTTSSALNGGIAGSYDSDIHALRDKSTIERGFCVEVPSPGNCEEQTDFSEDNGFASWPSVAVGETSVGTCQPGFTASVPLERKCIINPQDNTFYLEPLYRMDGEVKTYTNVKCVGP